MLCRYKGRLLAGLQTLNGQPKEVTLQRFLRDTLDLAQSARSNRAHAGLARWEDHPSTIYYYRGDKTDRLNQPLPGIIKATGTY